MFLESTQNQRCFNVEFDWWINVDKSTLNQRRYHVDRRGRRWKDDLPKSDLLGNVAIIERFEYSTSGSKLKKKTSIATKN